MSDITAIIPTPNEEKNIAGYRNFIQGFVLRAGIADSGSADRTLELARGFDFGDQLLCNGRVAPKRHRQFQELTRHMIAEAMP